MSERSSGSAGDRVALRFTRIMKATTSPLGMLTDPALVGAASAIAVVALLAALERGASALAIRALEGLLVVPLAVAVVVTLALSGARAKLVAWLGALPFSVDNMNAVLNGVGDELVVVFEGEPPASPELNARLDAVHPDCFVTKHEPAERTVEIRIGVVDSKRNPASSNHARFARVRRLLDEVLVPLAREHAIVDVRVK
jgi:hypothetical protein